MCEDLPVPRLSPIVSLVATRAPLAERSPVPGTLSRLWSSRIVEIGRQDMVQKDIALHTYRVSRKP